MEDNTSNTFATFERNASDINVHPDKYTIQWMIITSVLATLLIILIVLSNIMVIVTIASNKLLQNLQNWLIVNLSVSDLLLGILIMPFSLAKELMGYWNFGEVFCDIHSAVDVLLCTASILNICLISIDRYWSIAHAINYFTKRTPRRIGLMMAAVWICSAVISVPPLLGWKGKRSFATEYPQCEVSTL